MYATRNLFALTGTATSINDVLGELRFKGLKVLPPGEELTESVINEAFGQNRSLAFSMHDYAQSRYIPCEAFVIDVCEYESQESHELAIFTSKSNVAQQFKDITIKLGLDIGDNKSNSSGLTGEPTRNDCAYCRYLAGYPGENERTVYRSPNFFVLPTLGEVCTGYLLIIPNEHVINRSEHEIMPICNREIYFRPAILSQSCDVKTKSPVKQLMNTLVGIISYAIIAR